MKNLRTKLSQTLILALVFASQAHSARASASAHETSASVIDGVWMLESMDVVDQDGNATPWCEGAFGVIIYTHHYMSTAVNCAGDPKKMVLYSGPFEIQGQTAFHHAQNSTSGGGPQVFSRAFQLPDENHLELRGALGESTVVVKWVRRS